MNFTIGGQPLFQPPKTFTELRDLVVDGWNFQATRLTEEFDYKRFSATRPEGTQCDPVDPALRRSLFASAEGSGEPGEGDTVISFGPPRPEREQEKIVKATMTEREARAEKARKTSERGLGAGGRALADRSHRRCRRPVIYFTAGKAEARRPTPPSRRAYRGRRRAGVASIEIDEARAIFEVSAYLDAAEGEERGTPSLPAPSRRPAAARSAARTCRTRTGWRMCSRR